MTDNKLDFIEQLFVKADLTIRSVDFWGDKIEEVVSKLDTLEAKFELTEKEEEQIKKLNEDLYNFLGHLQVESDNVKEIESQVQDYIKTESKKKTNKKKS